MKLYVESVSQTPENEKIYINAQAKTRAELINQLGARRFKMGETVYDVADVMAEPAPVNSTVPAVIGALIGILGGGVGVAAGGALGAAAGSLASDNEKEAAAVFNRSVV